jgi:dynamin-like GTPase MGM1, mitochondrial
LEDSFGPEQLYEIVKDALDQQVLDQLALRYWNKPINDLSPSRFEDEEDVANLPKADPENEYWRLQLDGSVAALTTMGVGRAATGVVKNAIQSRIRTLVDQSPFAHHPTARQKILEAASDILDDLYARTSDQVENSIKPFKPSRNMDKPRDIKVETPEWDRGRDHAVDLLDAELKQCQTAMKSLEKVSGGKWKLKEVMNFVDRARKGTVAVEGDSRNGAGGFSAQLLAQGKNTAAQILPRLSSLTGPTGREAVFLRDRADIIRMRILAVKSRQCKTPKNKYYCPEIFLDTVATKLATPAALHLQSDLLEEFYYHFPRELDQRLDHGLAQDEVERLAKEDRKVKEQLEFMRRKELLETVLDKMESLRRLEGLEKGRRRPALPERTSRWGI